MSLNCLHGPTIATARPRCRTEVSACVRKALNIDGLNQFELSDRLGVSTRTLRRWMSGDCDLGVIEAFMRDPELAARILLALLDKISPSSFPSSFPANDNSEEKTA